MLLLPVADDRDAERQVCKVDQRVEEHVRPFFSAQPTNPSDPKSLRTHAEATPCRRAVKRRCGLLPRVLHDVNPVGRNTIPQQLLLQRAGHNDHGVKTPVGAPLQALVKAVSPIAPREAVDRGNGGNAHAASGGRVHYIRSIPVSVHDVGVYTAGQIEYRGPFAQIRPTRNRDRMWRDPAGRQGSHKRVIRAARL